MFRLLNDLNAHSNTLSCYTFGEYLHLSLKSDNSENKIALLDHLENLGNQEIEMTQVEPTIEDCFINLLKN